MTSNLLNGAALSAAALKVDDQGAFELLLGNLLKAGIDPSIFRFSGVTPGKDTAAQLTARVSREDAPVDMWVYRDTQVIPYTRLSLAALQAKWGSAIYTDFPTGLQELLSTYLTKNGLYDRGEQVLDAPVTGPGNQTLTAAAESLLLCGEASFVIKQLPKYLRDVVEARALSVFDASKDMVGDALTVLVNAVNTANAKTLPRPILASEVKADTPVMLSEYDVPGNTQVTLRGNNSEVFMEEVVLTYHRVNLGYVYSGAQLVVKGPTKPTLAYLLQQVRKLTGFTIADNEVQAQTFTTMPSGSLNTLTLPFLPASLRYVGEITIDYTAE